jgi:hypothetical protein
MWCEVDYRLFYANTPSDESIESNQEAIAGHSNGRVDSI